MVVLMRQSENGHIIYEIDYVKSWNEFLQWLYKVEQEDFSMCIKGNVYHFKTHEEKIQFIFGFEMALNVLSQEWDDECL